MSQLNRPQRAIVLCHGIGEHCFPFGGTKALRPKYAHEVGNVPLVTRAVNEILTVGINQIFIVAGFRGEAIEKLFQPPDERIKIIKISNYTAGDGHALTEALHCLDFRGEALVVNGDLMTFSKDYQNILEAYCSSGHQSTLLYDEMHPEEDKLSWVSLKLNEKGDRLEKIWGHIPDGKYRLSGLYAFSADDIEALKKASNSEESTYIFHRLSKMEKSFVAVKSVEPLVHVDRAFDYLEANQVIIKRAVDEIATATAAYVYIGGESDPDPEFIFPGTIIRPGARLVFENGSFIGPYDTKKGHLQGMLRNVSCIIPIRIRGDVYLGAGARIGLNSIIEGNLVMGAKSSVEDSVVEPDVLVGEAAVIRRSAVIRRRSVCGDQTRFECGADFEGVAGKGSIYMHPGQCWVVTGHECDLGAGNFFGTWRFDSGRYRYKIGSRMVVPKSDLISNASFIGDRVRTAIGVSFMPGTRVGADSLIGAGYIPHGNLQGGYAYFIKQETTQFDVKRLRKN